MSVAQEPHSLQAKQRAMKLDDMHAYTCMHFDKLVFDSKALLNIPLYMPQDQTPPCKPVVIDTQVTCYLTQRRPVRPAGLLQARPDNTNEYMDPSG